MRYLLALLLGIALGQCIFWIVEVVLLSKYDITIDVKEKSKAEVIRI